MCGCVRKLRFSRIYIYFLKTLILIIFGFVNINNGLTSHIIKNTTIINQKLNTSLTEKYQMEQQQKQQLNMQNQNLIISHISSVDETIFRPKTRQLNNNNNNNFKENDLIYINNKDTILNNGNRENLNNIINITNNNNNNLSRTNNFNINSLNSNSQGSSVSTNNYNFGGISSIGGGYISSRNSNINNNKDSIVNLNNNNNNNKNDKENIIENSDNDQNQQQTDSSADLDDLYNTPMYFGTENDTVITTQIGAIAHMPCTIHHIGDGVVTWIRRKDYHLLTVGLTTYNSDERFSATHLKHSEDWTLQIKFVQLRDAGIYECQVSTHPPTSIFLHLNVVEARAEITGPPIRYLTPGSSLRLQCRVLQNTQPSEFIFWYHDNRMINYDIDRGINVSTESDFQSSELHIQKTKRDHSGNFTCLASNAQPDSVLIHIFKGDNPAAMYHGDVGSSNKSYQNQILLNLLILISISKILYIIHTF